MSSMKKKKKKEENVLLFGGVKSFASCHDHTLKKNVLEIFASRTKDCLCEGDWAL